MDKFDKSDLVRIDVDFKNSSDTLTDPSTITFKFEDPSGTETTYVYGIDAELVKDGTGEYHADISTDESGTWSWRFIGTGTVEQVDEGQFYVLLSDF